MNNWLRLGDLNLLGSCFRLATRYLLEREDLVLSVFFVHVQVILVPALDFGSMGICSGYTYLCWNNLWRYMSMWWLWRYSTTMSWLVTCVFVFLPFYLCPSSLDYPVHSFLLYMFLGPPSWDPVCSIPT